MPRLTEKRKRQLEVEANGAKASSGLRELLDEVAALEDEFYVANKMAIELDKELTQLKEKYKEAKASLRELVETPFGRRYKPVLENAKKLLE